VHLPDELLELSPELRPQLLVGHGVQVAQALLIGERPVEQVAVTVGEGRGQAGADAVLGLVEILLLVVRGGAAGRERSKGSFKVLFGVNVLVLIVN
jgi:hypothetical protein